MTISKAGAEVVFQKQVFEFMEAKLKLLIIIRVEKAGATCLANNAVFGSRMKYVGATYDLAQVLIEK